MERLDRDDEREAINILPELTVCSLITICHRRHELATQTRTRFQSNLARCRVVILSSPMVANEFVQSVPPSSILTPPCIHMSHTPNGIPISSADFAQLICVPNTQTTLRATSVAMGRIHPMRARDATWNESHTAICLTIIDGIATQSVFVTYLSRYRCPVYLVSL